MGVCVWNMCFNYFAKWSHSDDSLLRWIKSNIQSLRLKTQISDHLAKDLHSAITGEESLTDRTVTSDKMGFYRLSIKLNVF